MGQSGAGADARDRLTPGATAVVVAYNTPSIDLSWIPDDCHVVVVHNDDSLVTEAVTRPNVRHLRSPTNVGFGAAVNAALPLVSTDRVVLFNPDLTLRPEHWALLEKGGRNDVITMPVLAKGGHGTVVVARYPGPGAMILMGWRAGRLAPLGGSLRRWLPGIGSGAANGPVANEPRSEGTWPLAQWWVSGALLSVPTDLLLSVGGFDSRYFLYYEDMDLCRRLAGAHQGVTAVVRTPSTLPVHDVSASSRGASRWVERIRLQSAIAYASVQSGPTWRLATLALGARRVLLAAGRR